MPLLRWAIGIEEYEGALFESGIAGSWQMSIVLLNIFACAEIFAAVWILLGKWNKSLTIYLSIILMMYSTVILFEVNNQTYFNRDLCYIGIPFIGLLLIWLGAFGYVSIMKNKLEVKSIFPNWISGLIASVMSIVFLLLGPLNMYDFELLDSPYQEKYANWEPYLKIVEKGELELFQEEYYMLVFFNTGCEHCNASAKKLGVYLRKKKSKLKVLTVFFGQTKNEGFWKDEKEIEEFLVRNNLDVPYLKLVDYETFSMVGNAFPVFIKMHNNEPETFFIASKFNARGYDDYFLGD
ncbi:MAG: hypothetical protein H6598_10820 [Flavobacteriales bacterium]|nr:hypothetical protein [Flavobacteriales bacterium]